MNDPAEKKTVYRIAGYVKLAKLWERSREQAMEFHRQYFKDKCSHLVDGELYDVYIDITGAKNIYKRAEMLRLLGDCISGRVNCIVTPTRAYLAANHEEFCYLLHMLFSMEQRIDIVTEDDDRFQMNTIADVDDQRKALRKMADEYTHIAGAEYSDWQARVSAGIKKQQDGESR